MPVTPTYPGVYVQEVPSGVKTIAGVSTSVALFIGTSTQGPMLEPVNCTNYSTFSTTFGEDTSAGELPLSVKLFFLNGGTNCYVMRIADGATAAGVVLKTEAGADTLALTAKDLGVIGETIRAKVTYAGTQTESTFTLELFRWDQDSSGRLIQAADEVWSGLSMDPNSPNYAATFITQNSQLVDALDLNPAPTPASTWGVSLSGRIVVDTSFKTDWGALLGSLVTTNRFKLSLSGSPFLDIDLHGIVVDATPGNLTAAIKGAIETTFANKGYPGTTVDVSFVNTAAGNQLRITRASGPNGDVLIRPGSTVNGQKDLAVALMLGSEQGGLEIGAFAKLRPAPTGITFAALDPANFDALANLQQGQVTSLTLEAIQADGTPVSTTLSLQPPASPNVVTTGATDLVNVGVSPAFDGIREKLAIIADAINEFSPPAGQTWPWAAQVNGYRLTILPTADLPDNFLSSDFKFTTSVALPGAAFTNNVHYYSLGAAGQSIGFQVSAASPASDGTAPLAADYDTAYTIADKEIDLFNLLILPTPASPVVPVQSLYADASIFCQQRRAFLIMDAPSSWTSAQQATTAIAGLRVGLVKDYSGIFFPRLTISDQGLSKNIGPSGAIAGVFARIDGTRGVWKAPAGTEADLRGITGLERRFSDGENGVLNPRAINTLRIFPNGIVNWGARTMDGDDGFGSEYKYIPIRRLALYIEESLYRGLKWVVFEPNDEPLWSQVRLNVGSFMHDLFRQGAFQGATAKDAYFVKCDAETTTQSDRNLGIVNIWVGFAPLKPAEFVILYLQQMAGQVQV